MNKTLLEQELDIVIDMFERFMPKNIAVDSRKELAMYEAYHRIKKIKESGYAAAPQKGMKWVKASERLPEIWKCHGSASEKVPIKLYGEFFHVGRIVKNGGRIKFEIFDGKNPTDFESESFHLIEWLDESPSPSEAGDGWSKEKPTFKEDCILLTASWWKGRWEVNQYNVVRTYDEDEKFEPIWYWALLHDDQEWGDIEDLQADLYRVISFPAPPIQK